MKAMEERQTACQARRRLLIRMVGLGVLAGLAPVCAALPAWGGSVPLPRRRPEGLESSSVPAKAALPVIVLDAGHGGRDPGAVGPRGTYEKDVTLDIVRKMAEALSGKARVVLTREKDVFLSLPERVAVGRRNQANLFVSIHADSAPDPLARGLSVYTLSETASDSFAGQLAAGENRVDQQYGAAVAQDAAVADILYDLVARQTTGAARYARDALITGVREDIALLDQPRRAANFAVLRAPDVPSVLIETGFLSNPADEDVLADPPHRQALASVLSREILRVVSTPLFR